MARTPAAISRPAPVPPPPPSGQDSEVETPEDRGRESRGGRGILAGAFPSCRPLLQPRTRTTKRKYRGVQSAPMPGSPIPVFARWYARACRAGETLRDASALATADRRGRPSVRFVLLKGADE